MIRIELPGQEDTRRMTVETHVVEARTHGRYLLRVPSGDAAGILIGFHGYMENAERHLAELARLPGSERWALLAVDALHAFYASESGAGRVVRGWMTRDLRDEAIADNVRYVRIVVGAARARFGWRRPVVCLGFSQGASMAWRASLLAGHEVAATVALAGDVPPELGGLPDSTPFPPRALLARGEADDWYRADTLARDQALLAARPVAVETLVFRGGHEWADEFRAAVGRLLGELAA